MKITLASEDFNRIMRVCVPALETASSPHESLKYIQVRCNGEGEGCATALDGYTLAQTRFPCTGEACEMLIPKHKNVRKDCIVTIEQKGDEISVSDGIETVTRKAVKGPFAATDAIIRNAQEPETTITVHIDRHRLRNALRSYANSGSVLQLEIRQADGAIIVRGLDSCGLVLPMQVHRELEQARFWHEQGGERA